MAKQFTDEDLDAFASGGKEPDGDEGAELEDEEAGPDEQDISALVHAVVAHKEAFLEAVDMLDPGALMEHEAEDALPEDLADALEEVVEELDPAIVAALSELGDVDWDDAVGVAEALHAEGVGEEEDTEALGAFIFHAARAASVIHEAAVDTEAEALRKTANPSKRVLGAR